MLSLGGGGLTCREPGDPRKDPRWGPEPDTSELTEWEEQAEWVALSPPLHLTSPGNYFSLCDRAVHTHVCVQVHACKGTPDIRL